MFDIEGMAIKSLWTDVLCMFEEFTPSTLKLPLPPETIPLLKRETERLLRDIEDQNLVALARHPELKKGFEILTFVLLKICDEVKRKTGQEESPYPDLIKLFFQEGKLIIFNGREKPCGDFRIPDIEIVQLTKEEVGYLRTALEAPPVGSKRVDHYRN